MNNYQAQQDLNTVIAFATSIVALGFVVSVVGTIIPFSGEEPKRIWLVYVTPEGKWGAWDISPYKPTLAIYKEDPKKYLKEWAEYYYLDAEAQVQRGRFAKYWISEATTRYRAIKNVQAMALPEHHSSTLQQFIDAELEKLVSRHGYRPYGISFEGRDVLDGAIGGHLGGFIFLAENLKDYWVYDNKKARVLVKYTIAHEYSHLIVLHEGVEKYLPKGIEEKDKEEYLEGIADGFATKWVGFTVEDIDKIIEALDEFCRFREQV